MALLCLLTKGGPLLSVWIIVCDLFVVRETRDDSDTLCLSISNPMVFHSKAANLYPYLSTSTETHLE